MRQKTTARQKTVVFRPTRGPYISFVIFNIYISFQNKRSFRGRGGLVSDLVFGSMEINKKNVNGPDRIVLKVWIAKTNLEHFPRIGPYHFSKLFE